VLTVLAILDLLVRLHLHGWALLMRLLVRLLVLLVHLLVRMHLSLYLCMLDIAVLNISIIRNITISIVLHPWFHPRFLMHMAICDLCSVHLMAIHVVTIF
jgi:hypothetical protein